MAATMHVTAYQTYGERSEDPSLTPLATYLLRLMHLKQTNLCVSADVTTTNELLSLAEEVGDNICILKTHADIISDFNEKTIRGLNELSRRKKFIVFEDRKFGDIGNTVQLQYTAGPLNIVRWAPIINAHIFPGPAVITSLAEAAKKAINAFNTSVQTDISASPMSSALVSGLEDVEDYDVEPSSSSDAKNPSDAKNASDSFDAFNTYRRPSQAPSMSEDRKSRKHSVVSVSTTISTKTEALSPQPQTPSSSPDLDSLGPPPFFRALLLLAQMSSADNFFTEPYTAACAHHARLNRPFVMGFIAQKGMNSEPGDNFLTMTPGVQKAAGGDGKGQQYNTPRTVVLEAGADVIIVGRGIYKAEDRRAESAEYRRQGWEAYEERLRAGKGL